MSIPLKKNKYRYQKKLQRPLGKMLGFRGYEAQSEKIKTVPNWQERLREYVDQLIAENLSQKAPQTDVASESV